jgi:hypothetical protein
LIKKSHQHEQTTTKHNYHKDPNPGFPEPVPVKTLTTMTCSKFSRISHRHKIHGAVPKHDTQLWRSDRQTKINYLETSQDTSQAQSHDMSNSENRSMSSKWHITTEFQNHKHQNKQCSAEV